MELNKKEIDILPDGRMNAENAAKYIGFTVASLSNMRYLRTGPKYVKRGMIFYFKADIDDWIEQGKRDNGKE